VILSSQSSKAAVRRSRDARIPAIAKGYSRKEVWNDPENAKLQSFPEFVKLVKSGTSK
jgi:hypothetical protein